MAESSAPGVSAAAGSTLRPGVRSADASADAGLAPGEAIVPVRDTESVTPLG